MNTTAGRYFIENNRECTFRTCLKEMDRAPFATMGNRYVLTTTSTGGATPSSRIKCGYKETRGNIGMDDGMRETKRKISSTYLRPRSTSDVYV